MTMTEQTLWRHKKRGTTYEIITDSASLQCSAAQEFEDLFADDNWTVYRNVDTGAIYVRPTPEFLDGRFERADGEQARPAKEGER
jgi:hypothetical protein